MMQYWQMAQDDLNLSLHEASERSSSAKFQNKPHPETSHRRERGLQPLREQLAAVGAGAIDSWPPGQQLQQDHAIRVHIRLLAELPCADHS